MAHQIAIPGKPGKSAPSPYQITALLVADMQKQVHSAAGVIRRKDGTVERKTWPKENMARYSDCTHCFIITRDPATWATGFANTFAKALNPDVASTGSTEGLYEVPAGQLPTL